MRTKRDDGPLGGVRITFLALHGSRKGKMQEQDLCRECFSDPDHRSEKVVQRYDANLEKNIECSNCGEMIAER